MSNFWPTTRRQLLAGLSSLPASALLPRLAFAAYPDRTIQFVVPFAAGGNADVVGRVIADVVSQALKQPVIIDNRPGAGGAVGAAFVTRAKPDGYTMMVASNGPMTVNPFVNANLGYEPLKDFAPIALSSYIPHVLAVSEKSGIKSIAELIAKAKAGPINIGTSGVGSASHMTLARFEHAIGAKLTHVPYRGGGQLLPDVISGVIDGAMTEISNVVQLHKANQLRIIGSASVTRPQLAPDVATFDEGGVKGFLAQSYVGLVAPAKTPTDIIEAVANAIRDGFAAGKPAATTVLGQGSAIAKPEEMTPAGFAAFLKREYDEMAIAAKAAGIVPS
jgi:tripartite-type tricarboxylate transporter receptor subunit TctC